MSGHQKGSPFYQKIVTELMFRRRGMTIDILDQLSEENERLRGEPAKQHYH